MSLLALCLLVGHQGGPWVSRVGRLLPVWSKNRKNRVEWMIFLLGLQGLQQDACPHQPAANDEGMWIGERECTEICCVRAIVFSFRVILDNYD